MRSRFFGVVLFMFCFHLLVGISLAFGAQENINKKVGVFIFRLDDSFVNLVSKAIEDSLDGKVEAIVFDAKQDHLEQFNQIVQFIKNGGDAVAINLVDVKLSHDILRIIHDYNVPIVFFNKEPHLKDMKNYSNVYYVGSLAEQAGIMQGNIISSLWKSNPQFDRNNDHVCDFIMLQGNIDNPEALARSKFSVQRARKLGVNIQQIGDTLICDWDQYCAYAATKLVLNVRLDEIDMIIANNDSMALGAIQALQEKGFNIEGGDKVIPVVGVDGLKKAKQFIADGIMHGTVIQDATAMGNAVATLILNQLNNKPHLDGLPYKWAEHGIDIRIPYQEYILNK